jgi:hypothetical protein
MNYACTLNSASTLGNGRHSRSTRLTPSLSRMGKERLTIAEDREGSLLSPAQQTEFTIP